MHCNWLWIKVSNEIHMSIKHSSQSQLYCQFCHMYRTYIQRIEIALLSDSWCIQITLTVECKIQIIQIKYTGACHIIRISSKSWFISQIPFKKWNLYNVYIHSTQTDIFQVFISFNFDDYKWQLMKTPNSVSQKIRILLKTNTKKGFLEILANWKVWTWKVWACTALNT